MVAKYIISCCYVILLKALVIFYSLHISFSFSISPTLRHDISFSVDAIDQYYLKALSLSSTTYLRCWYRTGGSHNDPSTAWVWGRDSQGEYYKLTGYWYNAVESKNMFYTDVSRLDVESACINAVPSWVNHQDIIYFAADHHYSYNDTIWFNDKANVSRINKMVSFGDSLSDTGNMFNASDWDFPNPHSWFVGHFSNGRVWTEYLALSRRIPLYNWAVGGAAGRNEYGLITGIHAQVKSYLDYMHFVKNFNYESVLFTMEFGLNDFMNYDRELSDVQEDFSNALNEIIRAGAKNILLLTLPDATVAPQFQYKTLEKKNRIRSQIENFNMTIKETVKRYNREKVHIELFDTAKVLSDLIDQALEKGFVNVKEPCLDIHRDDPIDYLSEHDLTDACKLHGADKYIFWGVTHPTTATYRYISDRINQESMQHFIFEQ
ncbi:MAG: SGNH/GDSL hydrolase family protein [Cellvibrionales bacterium]|nr:SGNH/GDSL hydrolase family protein [Cellvibrionales bacterium]